MYAEMKLQNKIFYIAAERTKVTPGSWQFSNQTLQLRATHIISPVHKQKWQTTVNKNRIYSRMQWSVETKDYSIKNIAYVGGKKIYNLWKWNIRTSNYQ